MAEPKPAPPPDGPPEAQAADESFASEFLSEASPDFEKLRKGAGDRRLEPVTFDHAKKPAARAPVTLPVRPPPPGAPTVLPPRRIGWTGIILAVLAIGAAPAYILYQNRPSGAGATSAAGSQEGTVTIDSRPPGATVFIDGVTRGVTPLRLSMAAGVYSVELKSGSGSRTLSMRVEPGESLRESVELAPLASTGRLEVTSDTPGARVMIDGVPSGTTPVSVPDVPAGAHRIAVTANGITATRTVIVEPGSTASISLSPPATPPAPPASGGWVTIQAPFELQVLEAGQVVGTSSASRIMLPVGRHELELRATPFGFTTMVSVDVAAGRSVTVPVSVPNGRLSINATPWAEVFLDGQNLGQTPVANISVPIGPHQVVWRHPQHGERRDVVNVTAEAPVRLGMDMPTGRVLGR